MNTEAVVVTVRTVFAIPVVGVANLDHLATVRLDVCAAIIIGVLGIPIWLEVIASVLARIGCGLELGVCRHLADGRQVIHTCRTGTCSGQPA